MTSKLTREQLHERARENVKALKLASRQTAFESARKEILADLQLAEIALAAMDSEPVAEITEDLGRLFVKIHHPTTLKAGDKLYRHAQQSVVPVSYKEPISFDDWSRKCALQVTLCYSDFREKAQYIWDSARETMHVAPVAMPECFSNAVSALESLYRNGQKQGWNERYTTDMAYASGVLNACRAAMLAAAPQSPGSEPATVPGKWIPVSERMPPIRHEVLVGCWWGEKPRWCCKWATYIPGHPDAQSSGWLLPGASWTPTHWMELPDAPQEAINALIPLVSRNEQEVK